MNFVIKLDDNMYLRLWEDSCAGFSGYEIVFKLSEASWFSTKKIAEKAKQLYGDENGKICSVTEEANNG